MTGCAAQWIYFLPLCFSTLASGVGTMGARNSLGMNGVAFVSPG
jgi:hypothetical protein